MYDLNTQDARQADQKGGRIEQTGRYTGTIVVAESVTSQKGTRGVDIHFKADDGQTSVIQIWTIGADQKPLHGMKTISAIMACSKVRKLSEELSRVEKYDFDAGERVVMAATVLPELTGKRIGFLLQKEWYTSQKDGSDRYKMNCYAPFEAATGCTATEVLDQKPAAMLDKMAATLKDRDSRQKQTTTRTNGGVPPIAPIDAYSDAFDDDLPF